VARGGVEPINLPRFDARVGAIVVFKACPAFALRPALRAVTNCDR